MMQYEIVPKCNYLRKYTQDLIFFQALILRTYEYVSVERYSFAFFSTSNPMFTSLAVRLVDSAVVAVV